MNTKEQYTQPQVEVIEIETTENIMNASREISENSTDQTSRSRRRGFWNGEEE